MDATITECSGLPGVATEAQYKYESGSLGCGFFGTMGSKDFCTQQEFNGRCLSLPNHCPVSSTVATAPAVGTCYDGQCAVDYYG